MGKERYRLNVYSPEGEEGFALLDLIDEKPIACRVMYEDGFARDINLNTEKKFIDEIINNGELIVTDNFKDPKEDKIMTDRDFQDIIQAVIDKVKKDKRLDKGTAFLKSDEFREIKDLEFPCRVYGQEVDIDRDTETIKVSGRKTKNKSVKKNTEKASTPKKKTSAKKKATPKKAPAKQKASSKKKATPKKKATSKKKATTERKPKRGWSEEEENALRKAVKDCDSKKEAFKKYAKESGRSALGVEYHYYNSNMEK